MLVTMPAPRGARATVRVAGEPSCGRRWQRLPMESSFCERRGYIRYLRLTGSVAAHGVDPAVGATERERASEEGDLRALGRPVRPDLYPTWRARQLDNAEAIGMNPKDVPVSFRDWTGEDEVRPPGDQLALQSASPRVTRNRELPSSFMVMSPTALAVKATLSPYGEVPGNNPSASLRSPPLPSALIA